MWERKQVEKLYENEYALNLSNSLYSDVYPSIHYLMTKLGMKQTEFHLGKNTNDDHQHYRCVIKHWEDGLIISFQRLIDSNVYVGNDGFRKSVEMKEYSDFNVNFQTTNPEIDYCREDGKFMKINSNEPIFYAGIFFHMSIGFKTAVHFYLFYCQNIVDVCQELKTNYRDGFIKLQERINLLTFPLERKVLLEKKINGKGI